MLRGTDHTDQVADLEVGAADGGIDHKRDVSVWELGPQCRNNGGRWIGSGAQPKHDLQWGGIVLGTEAAQCLGQLGLLAAKWFEQRHSWQCSIVAPCGSAKPKDVPNGQQEKSDRTKRYDH